MGRLKTSLTVGSLIAVAMAAFVGGALLRPRLESLFSRSPDQSLHESRRTVENWKYSPLQVLSAEWKFTGEMDRAGGKDELIWAWKVDFLHSTGQGLPEDECKVSEVKFELLDPQGFAVSTSTSSDKTIAVPAGKVVSVQGQGRMASAIEARHPRLRSQWQFTSKCPRRLPMFGKAKVTEIMEEEKERVDDGDSLGRRRLGSVKKVKAEYSPQQLPFDLARCRRDSKPSDRVSCEDMAQIFKEGSGPRPILVQFPRGAKLSVGDEIHLYHLRQGKDSEGEHTIGFGFTETGLSYPLTWRYEPGPK